MRGGVSRGGASASAMDDSRQPLPTSGRRLLACHRAGVRADGTARAVLVPGGVCSVGLESVRNGNETENRRIATATRVSTGQPRPRSNRCRSPKVPSARSRDGISGTGRKPIFGSATGILAYSAEGEGFEPSADRKARNGFRPRRSGRNPAWELELRSRGNARGNEFLVGQAATSWSGQVPVRTRS